MKTEETIFQVLTEGRSGNPVLHEWYGSEEEAKSSMEQAKRFWPDDPWWIEKGTNFITTKCKGCGSVHAEECHDAYGIFTGFYCRDCYENNYPYRKDRYDYQGAGERLDDEY